MYIFQGRQLSSIFPRNNLYFKVVDFANQCFVRSYTSFLPLGHVFPFNQADN